MPSPTAEDIRNGRAIASWNVAHGIILRTVTEACDALDSALAAANSAPSDATYAAVRLAGENLATISGKALRGPWAGVPEFDEPRRSGLECYRQAGELTTGIDGSREGDERALEAAALLNKGTVITSRATQFGKGLLQRLTPPS